MLALFIKVSEM